MQESEQEGGGCLCGAVRFEVTVPEKQFAICHCGMCRKWSAGPFMSVHCPGEGARFPEDQGLHWYRGSEWAERGFCGICGTSLFWRLADTPDEMLIISVEAFDNADKFKLAEHIYTDAQPDRYAFADDCPHLTEAEILAQFQQGS